MELLIWAGAALSIAGLVALLWCAGWLIRSRNAGLPDAALRERLRRAVAINLGALLTSLLGLMLIVVGVLLTPG